MDTTDLRIGMSVRRFSSEQFQVIESIWPVGKNGAKVVFTNGTRSIVGLRTTWESGRV